MERMGEHINEQLADELAGRVTHAVRETVREELTAGVRAQRRRAALYAGAGVAALYAGAAVALALGLVLALGMPDWGAALVVAVVLAVAAYVLRGVARPGRPPAPTAPPMPTAPPTPGA
ncbi:phage holin family protein [Streptomyces sp. NPDC002790]|uniref:phage holin family protein n=1 Tax=Streptomyces sp. NPDC002790 TaxID=3154431 RepID=UPI00331BA992